MIPPEHLRDKDEQIIINLMVKSLIIYDPNSLYVIGYNL